MSVTPNFSWPLIQPTDFVTDLPTDLEALADDIDADVWAIKGTADAALPETIIDAAGDLIYGSAADTAARLAIGTAGQVLTVNSGATAPEWATPAPAGAANWTLLNTGGTTLTGAQTITISGISNVDKIMILFANATSGTAGGNCSVRINTDTGNNYYQASGQVTGANTYAATIVSQIETLTSALDQIAVTAYAINTGSSASGSVILTGCSTSGVKQFTAQGSATASTSNGHIFRTSAGYWNSSASVTSISMFSGTGNFTGGTVYVYTSA